MENKNNTHNMKQNTTLRQQNAAVMNKNGKILLSWLVLMVAIMLMPTFAMSQSKESKSERNSKVEYVKFVEVSATKTYPEGTQITYVQATGLPTDKSVVDKMEEYLVKMMRVTRVYVYLNTNQGEFMFEGDADINPEWVVDEMNIFLRAYYAELDREKE